MGLYFTYSKTSQNGLKTNKMTAITTSLQPVWINGSSIENHKKIWAHLLAANKYLEVPVMQGDGSATDYKIVSELKCDCNPFTDSKVK